MERVRGEQLGATAPWQNRSQRKKNKPALNTKLRILPVVLFLRNNFALIVRATHERHLGIKQLAERTERVDRNDGLLGFSQTSTECIVQHPRWQCAPGSIGQLGHCRTRPPPLLHHRHGTGSQARHCLGPKPPCPCHRDADPDLRSAECSDALFPESRSSAITSSSLPAVLALNFRVFRSL